MKCKNGGWLSDKKGLQAKLSSARVRDLADIYAMTALSSISRVFFNNEAAHPLTYIDNYHRCKWVCHGLRAPWPGHISLCEFITQFFRLWHFVTRPVTLLLQCQSWEVDIAVSIRHSTKNRKNQLQHSFPDSTSRQDVRAAAEACGDATVRGQPPVTANST